MWFVFSNNVFTPFLFFVLANSMTEDTKGERCEDCPIERKRMRFSEEGKERISFEEIKVVSLCEALRASGICDKRNRMSKACRKKAMELKDKRGYKEEDLVVLDYVCCFEMYPDVFKGLEYAMMLGLRGEIRKNKHLLIGLMKGLEKLEKKSENVVETRR